METVSSNLNIHCEITNNSEVRHSKVKFFVNLHLRLTLPKVFEPSGYGAFVLKNLNIQTPFYLYVIFPNTYVETGSYMENCFSLFFQQFF